VVAELLKRLVRVPDRLLHARRRHAALASLLARQPPARVLVVCNGNMFRSPFAAAALRRVAGPRVQVESAGFLGPGRATPRDALSAAAGRGVDLSAHRSQLITGPLVQWADLIVVMDAAQRRTLCDRFGCRERDILILGDLDPERITTRGIEDPVEQSVEVCRRVYARIERCVAELVRVWWSARAARRA
jgi:protein-tyrosine-phosphatase